MFFNVCLIYRSLVLLVRCAFKVNNPTAIFSKKKEMGVAGFRDVNQLITRKDDCPKAAFFHQRLCLRRKRDIWRSVYAKNRVGDEPANASQ